MGEIGTLNVRLCCLKDGKPGGLLVVSKQGECVQFERTGGICSQLQREDAIAGDGNGAAESERQSSRQ